MSGILNKFRRSNSGINNSGGISQGYNQGQQQQQGYQQGYNTVNNVEANPILERTVVGAPVIQEHIRNDRIVEVQPVLHRNVDQTVVHHIERHIHEPSAPNQGGAVYERNPIVQQSFHTNIVHEVQPIIHRERVVPVSERVETHLMQRVAEPTIHTHEVVHETSPISYAQTGYGVQGQQADGHRNRSIFRRH